MRTELERQLDAPIDVYPVGWLAAWQRRHIPRPHGHRHPLHRELRYVLRHASRGRWRAVRNTFNGYLAEARTDKTRRAGHGWTKQRALRDLARHAYEMGVLS